jgi:hypothetical protein
MNSIQSPPVRPCPTAVEIVQDAPDSTAAAVAGRAVEAAVDQSGKVLADIRNLFETGAIPAWRTELSDAVKSTVDCVVNANGDSPLEKFSNELDTKQ